MIVAMTDVVEAAEVCVLKGRDDPGDTQGMVNAAEALTRVVVAYRRKTRGTPAAKPKGDLGHALH